VSKGKIFFIVYYLISMTHNLILYGTEYCHLCEEAEAILARANLSWHGIEIADEGALLQRYGTRIPVLRRDDNNAELDWPFDDASVQRFIKL
jgi:glutaredoxin-related protein